MITYDLLCISCVLLGKGQNGVASRHPKDAGARDACITTTTTTTIIIIIIIVVIVIVITIIIKPPKLGKGQMGSALMGSLQIFVIFNGGTFWVPICQHLSILRMFFPNLSKLNPCSGPMSIDTICPQPNHHHPER